MKKLLAVLLALTMALSLAACGASETPAETEESSEGAESFRVGILQYTEHVALDSAREGFIDALEASGLEVEVDVQNAQADQSNLTTIGQKFISDGCDLILAIATPAAQSIAAQTTDIPILITAVTDPVDANLVDSNEVPGGNISGTSDMNPVAEQIELLLQLAPETETVGLLYTSSEDNSILQAAMAAEAAEAAGVAVVEQTVTSSNDVQQAAQSLVGKCDAIYIPTDNILAASMSLVGAVAIEAGIPIVCGESGMVSEGGLATLGINYYDLGYQTGEMAVEVLEGADIGAMPIETAEQFDFTINAEMVEALGISVPEELAQYVA
ncbi:MAG: ABC transporter substrate-binding protein [Oscillospiraceae bacterium]|nr:ABC transporter substrate-binding protein [Oscillospiraceae bacterium]